MSRDALSKLLSWNLDLTYLTVNKLCEPQSSRPVLYNVQQQHNILIPADFTTAIFNYLIYMISKICHHVFYL